MKPAKPADREKKIFKILILSFLAIFAVLVGYAIGWQVKTSVIANPGELRHSEEAVRPTKNLGDPSPSSSTASMPRTQDDGVEITLSLADYGPAPEFSLTERSGETFSKSRLLGKPWIVNFIFTSCAGQCPLMSAQMAALQSRFSPETGLQFVSFTVDPERDTPEVLSEYADRFQAEKGRWFFLTGPRPEINRILKEFFLSPVEEPAMHSIRFILVDPKGEIRGYYDSGDAEAMKQLGEDANLILQGSHPEAAGGRRRISEILQPPPGASE